jgi:hypothetical protein
MRLAGSRRRWTGCRKNARGSDAKFEAPGLGTSRFIASGPAPLDKSRARRFRGLFGRALLRSTTYGRGICLRRKPHCSLWKGSLASFGAVRPTLSGATCPLPPSALGQERGERERADPRHPQGREMGGRGGVAQRPPIHRDLYAERLHPGDGSAAERMPGEVTPGLTRLA